MGVAGAFGVPDLTLGRCAFPPFRDMAAEGWGTRFVAGNGRGTRQSSLKMQVCAPRCESCKVIRNRGMAKDMNDRQRTQLAAYSAEADKISEDWQIERWISRVTTFLAAAMGEDEAVRFRRIDGYSPHSNFALKLGHIEGLIAQGEEPPTIEGPGASNQSSAALEAIVSGTREVFVVHGHDGEAKESVARFLEKLELDPIILHEQPNQGRTVIEKFETSSKNVAFAVVLLTPDDMGGAANEAMDLHPRARQNVILELGYFMGRLGRTRVCALYKGGVELPSDFQGVVYIEFDQAGAWRMKLAQEFVEAKLTIKVEGLIN